MRAEALIEITIAQKTFILNSCSVNKRNPSATGKKIMAKKKKVDCVEFILNYAFFSGGLSTPPAFPDFLSPIGARPAQKDWSLAVLVG
jgi:hypothetical protein